MHHHDHEDERIAKARKLYEACRKVYDFGELNKQDAEELTDALGDLIAYVDEQNEHGSSR